MSERHREALAHLLYGVEGGGGFVLLTGEIGAGKTTVCRAFIEQIPRHCHVAYIFNPKLTVAELLRTACDEFGIEAPEVDPQSDSLKPFVDAINAYLLNAHAQGQNCVLIIDEAQSLSAEVLEQLRLLTNLETSERKLLQIILIGQPELRTLLARPELEQLAQRVIARYHLQALTEAETGQYIVHRLAVSGLQSGTLFDPKAIRRIHRITRGIPRRINLLCDRALLGAYANERLSVDQGMVNKAAAEVFGLVPVKRPEAAPEPGLLERTPVWVWGVLGGVAISCFGGAAALAWMKSERTRPVPTTTTAVAATRLPIAPSSVAPASGPTPMSVGASPLQLQPSMDMPLSRGAAAAPIRTTAPPPLARPNALASVAELNAWLEAAPTREGTAWTELAPLWGLSVSERDPCLEAREHDVQCFKGSGGLPLVAQLARPSVLTLYDVRGREVYALLTGLNERAATLRASGQSISIPVAELAKVWRGDFATLWRSPQGYRKRIEPGQSGAAVDWLATRMAQLHQESPPIGPQRYEPALQARVHAFQIAQGLKPDGMAGAMTIMLLNRATGVNEPRLTTEP
ncbi:MAG TPA: AAA family ATPase [Aquabacterium sp.]|uniref:ExeA family protein n=1 Tax=Aquabacterium sp. TaxID=1872578 RepID=UPI002E3755A5|nr:AAA family ATPase [Aquabacterium sp.]HEX5371813.1 AAA family ATPase [Aquabacterium sp.]